MNNKFTIEVYEYAEGYTVEVNGEVLLECLGADEVSDLTIGELDELRLKHFGD